MDLKRIEEEDYKKRRKEQKKKLKRDLKGNWVWLSKHNNNSDKKLNMGTLINKKTTSKKVKKIIKNNSYKMKIEKMAKDARR